MCVLQVNRWSRCNPRYLAAVCIGIRTLFIVTGGQSECLVVNVMWTDCLIDFDFPCVSPFLEDVEMVLEMLRSDDWISMGRKEPSVICEGGDSGVSRCG